MLSSNNEATADVIADDVVASDAHAEVHDAQGNLVGYIEANEEDVVLFDSAPKDMTGFQFAYKDGSKEPWDGEEEPQIEEQQDEPDKPGFFSRMGTSITGTFSKVVGQPTKKYVVKPARMAFDLAAMPIRDAYVYPFDTIKGRGKTSKQRLAEGTAELGKNAAMGAGGYAAFAAVAPIFTVLDPTFIAPAAVFGVPIVKRTILSIQDLRETKYRREQLQKSRHPKNMWFPSQKK